ncbi:uncharacterized protein [Centruroides vittatus]|uniref:uncharacterized protein n=1 Tax=Centruroides vittatus TaxID=120091 RepID=UPI00350F3322
MNSHEKFCCLSLDEMAIAQGVQYDQQGERFLCDVTLPEHEGYASQALVFVLGGITSRWKQTVAYFFSGNSCKGVVLHDILTLFMNIIYQRMLWICIVINLANYQSDCDLKLAPELTLQHLSTHHFQKTKVNIALKLFNCKTSTALRYVIDEVGWSRNVETTAWFIEVIAKWFNLMSSRHPVTALSLRDKNKYDEAIVFLKSCIEVFNGLTIGSGWKPVQSRAILSTTSVLDLTDLLLHSIMGRCPIVLLASL